jgi:hypothetical protein
MPNRNFFISSDELRELTKCGGSLRQIERLKQLSISFSLDAYGTPEVKRTDFDFFMRFNP